MLWSKCGGNAVGVEVCLCYGGVFMVSWILRGIIVEGCFEIECNICVIRPCLVVNK